MTQSTAGTALFSKTLGQFDEGAWTELLFFLFLIAMTGSVALIESRRLGVSRRLAAAGPGPRCARRLNGSARGFLADHAPGCPHHPAGLGNDAFARLVGHGASIGGIAPQLGVLAAYAAVLPTLAAWRLRRVLSG